MNDFGEDWRDLACTPAADSWITRPLQRAPEPEQDEPRYGKRGEPFTQDELDKYFAAGGEVDHGDARYAEQLANDRRYENRRTRRPMLYSSLLARAWDLINIVTEMLTWWDCSDYLERHRRVVRDILAEPRNQRRRKLAGLSTKERRHQHAIRLVHALAFEEISQSEYCRRHGLDRADASRMLSHLFEKESGLREAIDAIRATAVMVSWQFRQQQQVMYRYVRGAERRQKSDAAGTYSEGRLDMAWIPTET